ncbi:MAG TPA: GNAT family N-acetyltransferase [Candidatus Polarisedimenticolia bacterium]|jgi:CelD/BcsL family acetyltransferase involved in cellulose biosynthesis|nr:GNAT family N-acetyltransferase [Candidatus Polarisedimenticolia bacterium]
MAQATRMPDSSIAGARDAVRSVAPGAQLRVSLVTEPSAFLRLKKEWNALAESTHDEPFHRHEYVRSWIESFAPGASLRILTGRDERDRLVALLPLIERRSRLLGLGVREWSSPTNVHSFRFDFLALDPAAAAPFFLARLAAQREWDLLRLADVPPQGSAWHLYDAACGAGWPAGIYPAQKSPYLPLPASFDDLAGLWSSKFRSNLRRRRRLLERRGRVEVERVGAGPGLAKILDACFRLEGRGWKGKHGDSAQRDPRIGSFYRSLAERSGGSFSLSLLKLDGKLIAFHYGLTRRRVYSLLLTSYDESFRECSPGHLLVEEVLRDCLAEGVREFDFLGCDLEWKRAWTESSRSHSWLFMFRNDSWGRALRGAKFTWAPAARRMIGSFFHRGPLLGSASEGGS